MFDETESHRRFVRDKGLEMVRRPLHKASPSILGQKSGIPKVANASPRGTRPSGPKANHDVSNELTPIEYADVFIPIKDEIRP